MKLDTVFEGARAAGRVAFVPYVMAGDPDLATSELLLQALHAAGADAIELGIPYGDPLADGPTIAAAGARALANGVALEDAFSLVRHSAAPVVLFSYYNPIMQYGFERFAERAGRAGATGLIVPDIALEEAHDLSGVLGAHGLAMPLLVAPSTPLARAKKIADESGGFVYVVSRLGVTGAAVAPDFAPLLQQVDVLKTVTTKPLAVGFGVGKPEHVRAVAPHVDAVIVGSALIDAYRGHRGAEAVKRVVDFVSPLIEELHHRTA